MIERVYVVVPARDEEAVLGACLDSVGVAVERLLTSAPHLRVTGCVVLDRCRDGSAAVAAQRPWWDVLAVDEGNVGRVRARGISALAGNEPPERAWVANTDADTVVPPHWLVEQLRLAERGVRLVVGSVEPDRRDLSTAQLARWRSRHELVEGHRHVHGANLGFRLSDYLAVGGFPSLPVGEDVALVRALRAPLRPGQHCATVGTHVVTSGRLRGRAEGGFASYLGESEPPAG